MEGQKFSSDKLQMDKLFLQFPLAIQGIVLASTFGNEKYKETDHPIYWDNFKKVPNAYHQYKSAGKRHEFETEDTEESGLNPEFHILWNAVARFETWAMDNNIDVKKLASEFIPKWREQFKK